MFKVFFENGRGEIVRVKTYDTLIAATDAQNLWKYLTDYNAYLTSEYSDV